MKINIPSQILVSIIFVVNIAHAQQSSVKDFFNKAITVEELDENNNVVNRFMDFIEQKDGSWKTRSPDLQSFSWLGICFNEDGSSCKNTFLPKEVFDVAFAMQYGRKQLPPELNIPLPQIPFTASTEATVSSTSLVVKVTPTIFGQLQPTKTFQVKIAPVLGSVKLNFKNPDKDESRRFDVNNVADSYKKLALAVVQLQSRPDGEDILSNSSGSGTGYFLSSNGYMMTNHHVIDDFKECMRELVCEIDFRQTLPDNSKRVFTAKAQLLIANQAYDFALLKVTLPTEVKVGFIEIEKSEIGPELITLGYPGDQREKSETGEDITRLTYSFGELLSFHKQAFATNAYIYQGASGSPILNLSNLKLIGILSNGAGNPIIGVGAPGLARPIHLIDSVFGISDYLSGAKQARVRATLKTLAETQDKAEAAKLITQFQSEYTYMGVNQLKSLMVLHSSAEIRALILRGLEKMRILLGNSELAEDVLNSAPDIQNAIQLKLN